MARNTALLVRERSYLPTSASGASERRCGAERDIERNGQLLSVRRAIARTVGNEIGRIALLTPWSRYAASEPAFAQVCSIDCAVPRP
jgi:hypothetical protein